MNFGWRFNMATTVPDGWTRADFRDSSWTAVTLPHDAALEGGTRFTNATGLGTSGNGYLPCSTAFYRRTFRVPDNVVSGQSVAAVVIDGAQRLTRVWVDGVQADGGVAHQSGYVPLRIVLPSAMLQQQKHQQQHSLAILTDCSQPTGWWYEGGGLYRDVWLETTPAVHVTPWGIHVAYEVVGPITPPGPTSPWSRADAALKPRITVFNAADSQSTFWIMARAYDARDRLAAEGWSGDYDLAPGQTTTVILDAMAIEGAALWSPDTPELYTLAVELVRGETVVDAVNQSFGVRQAIFDAKRGLFLNGKRTLIKGVCNHQDFAGVGVAVPDNLQLFRVAKMKEMGANAWRAAHNPPTPALLDACDRLGLMVWDENHMNRVGGQFEDELRALIIRDRNHPSVIVWGLCNEKLCNGFDASAAKKLKALIQELDSSRPVTAAMDGKYGSAFQDTLDIIGINYHTKLYDSIHANRPNVPIIASETASSVSDRGIYFADKARLQVPAYDTDHVPWGNTAKDAWAEVEKRPFISGAFVWTGFDYKGEPTPFSWPSVASHFGAVDSVGFEKDNFYYYQNVWLSDRDFVHVLPHWNWFPQWRITIWTYSNGDQVEVLVNDKPVAGPKRFNNRLYYEPWIADFVPGNVTAIAYRAREEIARKTVVTVGSPRAVRLELAQYPMRTFAANGQDVALVRAMIVDKNGNVHPTAGNKISFTVYGPGVIAGVGNGNPNDLSPDKATWRNAFNGKCAVLVRSQRNQPGPIFVTARAVGLLTGQLTLTATPLTTTDPFHAIVLS